MSCTIVRTDAEIDEQLNIAADGINYDLSVMTFNQPLQPVLLTVDLPNE